jgi:3-oxoacyl-[acyl-carrier protein] reductase
MKISSNMKLGIEDLRFAVCGATRGFGRAVTRTLVRDGASVIAVARGLEGLMQLQEEFPGRINILPGDITQEITIERLKDMSEAGPLHGILVNASGPPPKTFLETSVSDWDEAYRSLLRWKVELVRLLLPSFLKQGYGRFVFIESVAIKNPLDNLILSNSIRMAVAGMVKSLSREFPDKGITFNLLAPGYHLTSAVERIIHKRAENSGSGFEAALRDLEKEIPAGKLGDPEHFASLAAWLLSPLAAYVNGQVFTVDGGLTRFPL